MNVALARKVTGELFVTKAVMVVMVIATRTLAVHSVKLEGMVGRIVPHPVAITVKTEYVMALMGIALMVVMMAILEINVNFSVTSRVKHVFLNTIATLAKTVFLGETA